MGGEVRSGVPRLPAAWAGAASPPVMDRAVRAVALATGDRPAQDSPQRDRCRVAAGWDEWTGVSPPGTRRRGVTSRVFVPAASSAAALLTSAGRRSRSVGSRFLGRRRRDGRGDPMACRITGRCHPPAAQPPHLARRHPPRGGGQQTVEEPAGDTAGVRTSTMPAVLAEPGVRRQWGPNHMWTGTAVVCGCRLRRSTRGDGHPGDGFYGRLGWVVGVGVHRSRVEIGQDLLGDP